MERLSIAVVELATDIFARDTGLSGPQLHHAFSPYTDALGTYPMVDRPSRWKIFQRGMEAISAEEQRAVLFELIDRDIPNLDPTQVDKLRQHLAQGARHSAQQLDDRLATLDWVAVDRSWSTTINDVATNPEAAIRSARTTLESVCKHICEERGQEYLADGDLTRLYKAAAQSLNVAPDQHSEQIIKQILSGATTTVQGIAGLRNALSDAHGKGKRAVTPAPRHARLAVNMAFSIATFLIDTHLEKADRPGAPRT